MVECHLAKVKVAGSNPVSRSKTKREVSTSLFVLERETGFTNPFAAQFISTLMNCAAKRVRKFRLACEPKPGGQTVKS